ncbi:MAG: hypothetical protein ACTSO9_05410 [Candidatus Helarchaeota archaeon]
MVDLVLNAILGQTLFLLIIASIIIETIIFYSIGRRYLQRKTTLLKYLWLSSLTYYLMIILTFSMIGLLIFNVQAIFGVDLFRFLSSTMYRFINILGMITLGVTCVFIFELFVDDFPSGTMFVIFLVIGFFNGLILITPISYISVGFVESINIYVYPTIYIMFASWIFQNILIFSWVYISQTKRKTVRDPVKQKGLLYIQYGVIFSLVSSFIPLMLRFFITDPSFIEIVQSNVYWLFSIFSNFFYYIGLVMPNWFKNRIIGSTWIEIQGKRI